MRDAVNVTCVQQTRKRAGEVEASSGRKWGEKVPVSCSEAVGLGKLDVDPQELGKGGSPV